MDKVNTPTAEELAEIEAIRAEKAQEARYEAVLEGAGRMSEDY